MHVLSQCANEALPRAEIVHQNSCYQLIKGLPMHHFIFNFEFKNSDTHLERLGSEKDVSDLAELFEKQEYIVKCFSNLTQSEIIEELNRIRVMPELKQTQILIITIMSHGDGKCSRSFVTKDGESFSMNDVQDMFSNSKCPIMLGKPKIFLCNFCRDIKSETSQNPDLPQLTCLSKEQPMSSEERLTIPKIDLLLELFDVYNANHMDIDNEIISSNSNTIPSLINESEGKQNIEIEQLLISDGRTDHYLPFNQLSSKDTWEDMIVIYSCEKKYPSYRHEVKGSVMIQSLCCILNDMQSQGNSMTISDIFYCLQRDMKSRGVSLPKRDDTLFTNCYLFPSL